MTAFGHIEPPRANNTRVNGHIWEARKAGRVLKYSKCRAEILGQQSLMRKTNFKNATTVITEMVEKFFAPPPPANIVL